MMSYYIAHSETIIIMKLFLSDKLRSLGDELFSSHVFPYILAEPNIILDFEIIA